MNKYLISFLVVLITGHSWAGISNVYDGDGYIRKVKDSENVSLNDDVKYTGICKYEIQNSSVVIDDFSDWQNWGATSVDLKDNVILKINDINTVDSGDQIEYLTKDNYTNVTIKDADNLYKGNFRKDDYGDAIYINIVRETDYKKVFNNSRGDFLENLRSDHHDDKMLVAMDSAKNMNEINSIMNSSFHFNPMVLMNPLKTINRAKMLDLSFDKFDTGAGARVNYILSNKLNDIDANLYVGGKYNDFYFNIGGDFNSFSYKDSFNNFNGFAYGVDVHARQYIHNLWFDGLLGWNQANFDADNIFRDDSIIKNPKGTSWYGRFNIGYDYDANISDFIITPIFGVMFQRSEILNVSEVKTNVLAGANGRYAVVIDGIKYEYGVALTTDEKTNWHVGTSVGFLSAIDNAGVTVALDAFKDEFDTNYKISVNAKIQF